MDAPRHASWRCHTTACLGSTVPRTGCRIRTEPMPRSEKDVLLPVPTAQRTRRERRMSAHLCIRGHGVGEHERGRTLARELALLRQRAPTRQAGSPEPRESAPVGAHSTAHTTRTTHVSAHLCIRGSWRGRARAWTHLGTRAAGAGRWTALLNRAAEPRRRIRPLDQPTLVNLQLQCPGHPRKNGFRAAVFG